MDKYGPPQRTKYRVVVENLSTRVSWQVTASIRTNYILNSGRIFSRQILFKNVLLNSYVEKKYNFLNKKSPFWLRLCACMHLYDFNSLSPEFLHFPPQSLENVYIKGVFVKNERVIR